MKAREISLGAAAEWRQIQSMKSRMIFPAAILLLCFTTPLGLAQEVFELQLPGVGIIRAEAGAVIQVQGGGGKVEVQIQVNAAGEAAAEEGEESDIDPEVEKMLTEHIDKWIAKMKEPRKGSEQKRLKALITEIQETTGLEKERSKPLEEAIDKAIDDSWEAYTNAQSEMLIQSWGMMMQADPAAQLKANEEQMANMDASQIAQMMLSQPQPDAGKPENHETWKNALKKALNTEELEIWNAELAAADEAKKEQVETIVERWSEAQSVPLLARLTPLMDKLKETIPLDDGRLEQLDELAEKAVEAAVNNWEEKIRASIKRIPLEQLSSIRQGNIGIGMELTQEPADTEIWKTGIEKILTDGESKTWATAWKKFSKDEAKELAEMAAKIIKARAANMRQQYGRQFDPVIGDILATLDLDEERETKLKKLAEEALDSFEEFWVKKNEEHVGKISATEKRTLVQRGYINVGLQEKEMPLNAEIWTEGVQQLLTEEEYKLWETSSEQREVRQKETFGKLLLMRMGKVIGLSPKQRKQLLPVLTKIGEARHNQRQRGQMISYNTSTFNQMFRNEEDQKKLAAKLDDSQKERWEEWLKATLSSNVNPVFERSESRPEPVSDDVFREEAITAFLYELRRRERSKFLTSKLGEVGQIARVAKLNADQTAELSAAAKGMAEMMLESVASGRSVWIRESTKDVPRETIYTRLTELGGNRFGISQQDTNAEKLWDFTMNRVLSQAQKEKWEEAVAEREKFEQSVIVQALVAQVESVLSLTSKQAEEMSPVFDALLTEYQSDLDMRFRGNSDPWYYNGYYSLSLVVGIEKETLSKILTDEQVKIWEKEHLPRMENYWEGIERNHKQRKEKEEKK
ncbi:MAG: hypothetical protein ACI8UO_004950 [Verrucomicrobiales bacterium]|jgi:hypothetical protein